LFKNNCNNFSDTCANFLVGCSIPAHILGLPNEVLNTQLGQTFRPFIDNFQNQLNQSSQGSQMFIPNTNQVQHNANKELVLEIMNENQFIDLIEKNKGVVIDFYSNTCPPCKKIKPVFQDLARKYQTICPTLKFCSLNVQNKELGNNRFN
jgi:thiol-disulfide isomerase/thioredoxin